ncbi:MAG: hypothetical protein HYV09_06350 [Deltaproteobacteria bacterium]|nr:hypothetical protein [Deltaproteobacteria bacterium]
MEAKIAAAALFGVLLACGGGRVTRWEPHSAAAPSNQIAVRTIEVGRGDFPALRAAGAMPLGTLTVSGRPENASTAAAAARFAVETGGTHYTLGTLGDTEGGAWSVTVPLKRDARYVVFRVPVANWERLPAALTPEPFHPAPQ